MTPADRVQEAVAVFGAATKAKLSNVGATGQPEDKLRAPMEALIPVVLGAYCANPDGPFTVKTK